MSNTVDILLHLIKTLPTWHLNVSTLKGTDIPYCLNTNAKWYLYCRY